MHTQEEIDKMFKVAFGKVRRFRKMLQYMEEHRYIFDDTCLAGVRKEYEMLKANFNALKRKYDNCNEYTKYLKDARIE